MSLSLIFPRAVVCDRKQSVIDSENPTKKSSFYHPTLILLTIRMNLQNSVTLFNGTEACSYTFTILGRVKQDFHTSRFNNSMKKNKP